MSGDGIGPKLYTHKPKKGQLKQKAKDFSTPPPNPSSAMGSTPPPPPPPPKESFARRYKFLWPMLLTVNLAIGVYILMRTNKKDTVGETEQSAEETTTTTVASTPAAASEKTTPVSPSIPEPVKIRQPIPENEQRELFKWMLEEKRKEKPSDPLEKKRIDEEKAILKQYIRAKSIPTL